MKSLIAFLFIFHMSSAVAQTEDLSGPPAIYAVETHSNLDDEVLTLPFLEVSDVAKSISDTLSNKPVQELIEDSTFKAHIRFVNRRSNRAHDMIFDSVKISEKEQENLDNIEELNVLDMMNGVSVTTDVSVVEDQLPADMQVYKNFQVQVKHCMENYNDVYGNDVAFVVLNDIQSGVRLFEGWLYKKRPSVHVFEHPVYSMYLISCSS